VTQEFHISITPVGQDQYLVQTKQVALKVPLAEALVILPLRDWLTQYEQLVIEALNAMLQSDEKLIAENSGSDPFAPLQSKIINLGQQLYNALFHGPLNDSWITAQAIAQKENKVLRLCLEVNELVLARLPWEIMHTGSCFLATDSAIEFSRHQPGEMPTTGLQQGIVKVLMAIAIPNSQDRLVLKQEATRLQAELGKVSLTDNFSNSKTQSHLEDSTDDLIAATELDFLDDEWEQHKDQVEMDFVDEDEWEQDEPGYEEDSALVSDLFHQIAKEPSTTAESPLISDFGFDQLPEVDASDPQSMPSEIPPYADKRNKSNDRATSAESTPATTNTSIERSPKSAFSNPQKVQRILPILQAVGVTAIALFGFWGFQRQLQQVSPPIPASQAVNDNLKTASTPKLQAIAIQHFGKGNLSAGSLAIEELLNRGALTSAKTALNAVSDAQAQTSEINFLRGRLGWQLIKTGDKNYSFDDVRRYWETAVKHKPNSPRYYSALGFVYYSQGELNKANQTWFQALYLSEEQEAKKTASTPVVAKRDQLNAYAGLALVLTKSAETQPTDKQAKLLREAIKLRQQVLTDDRVNFQPDKLSKTWLWTEKTIQDWRSLLQHQG
jgi:hypothetical protein